MTTTATRLLHAGSLADLQAKGSLVADGVVVFWHQERAFAVDNRCPHMGFPLARGSLANCILTCHWHHARFDLASGGTFDPWADDVRVYPVRVEDGAVLVDLNAGGGDRRAYFLARLEDGLEQNLSLVSVKAVIALLDAGVPAATILATGGRFGARYREAGWGPGLTILTAMGNVLEALTPEDRYLALYHGLVHTARDCAGQAPRFELDPLPTEGIPAARLRAWFRSFVAVRDEEGAERTLRTAIAQGAPPAQIADLLAAAATDYSFIAGGHTIDFINKACELLDQVGWQQAAAVLPSLIQGLCRAQRMEESNAWRHPIDLIALLGPSLDRLPGWLNGRPSSHSPVDRAALAATLLGDDPAAGVAALDDALAAGARVTELSQALAYAAALRIARFHTSNEFSDWITVLHTFTYANALDGLLRRTPSPELARGLYHGAMKLYLDRFLNMPAARLPDARGGAPSPAPAAELLTELRDLLDREQRVNEAGALVDRYLALGHPVAPLLATLGHLLLREDGEFHSYQMLEAGLRQAAALQPDDPLAARRVLVAVARYLAAHAPTSRAMLQTARIAQRLHRGETLYADESDA